ncbi:MAG: DoxX family protein [Rhodospirillaceae bacterium]|nr:DoxX family protein [Rhodospirillaceae bacterium]
MTHKAIADVIGRLESVPMWLIALVARFGVAGVFWRSARTKVDGFTIADNTKFLFEEEYKVPLLDPEVAALLATIGEHVFPIMLVIGLGARLGALGLLGMTAVIQLFVYPMSWPDHLLWTSALLLILSYGPGKASLDQLIRNRC